MSTKEPWPFDFGERHVINSIRKEKSERKSKMKDESTLKDHPLGEPIDASYVVRALTMPPPSPVELARDLTRMHVEKLSGATAGYILSVFKRNLAAVKELYESE